MKTKFVRQCSLGLTAGLIFSLGCARPKAQSEPARAAAVPPTSPALVAPAAPVGMETAANAAAQTPQDTNAPAILDRIPPTTKAEDVQMSAGLSEVVKLAQAGVGEEVILAYIEKYPGKFELGAEQILYLNDLGVSSTVMTAMLKHDGRPESDLAALAAANPPTANVPAAAPTEPPVVTAPLTPVAEPATVATTVAPPPTSSEVAYFYDSLSPYGSWVYLSGYGWCWQPTVAVSVPTWRPYCDRGRWYWSDAGWYWYSDYSWGWAAFHYGRWYHHAGSGWVWRPGLTWGPSWVSWRYYDGYCGWAPLPPEAHFVTGSGFTYYGRGVTVGFDFGLAPFHYTFVSVNNFCDYSPYRYVVPHARVNNFYRHTTVVNNYHVGRNRHQFINHGIGRETVARASTTRLREVSVRETPVRNVASVRGDRIERQGNQMVVYRPQLPKDPPAVRSTRFASRAAGSGQSAATVGRAANARGEANGNANVTAPGSSPVTARGQTSRGQGSVASRQTEVESARPQNNVEERRPVTNQRGNPSRLERNTSRDSTPNVTAPARLQNQPEARPQVQPQRSQTRGNAPLFGSGNTSPQPQNNPATSRPTERTPAPRVQSQPSQNNAASGRAYQQPQSRAQSGYTPQAQPRSSYGQGTVRNYSGQSMPPRQAEQSPRYNAPAQSAPAYRAPSYQAPQYNAQPSHPSGGRYSAPQSTPSGQVRSAPSGGGGGERSVSRGGGDSGGSRGGGGGGRSEGGGGRTERNR